jgi:hypothetical protein
MALETVRVYSIDENSDPLVGVLVQAYDSLDVFVTQNTTVLVGAEAYCELMLDGSDAPPTDYTIRLSKTGVAFDGLLGDDSKTPQAIQVYSPPSAAPVTGTNNFEVQGQTFSIPAAVDPRLCRASGFFVDLSGQPMPNVDLHFTPVCYNEDQPPLYPMIVDGLAVVSDKIFVRTDENGYLVIDLYREAELNVLVQGLEHSRRAVKVPDASSVNLIDLLFPVVTEIAFSPDPLSVASSSYTDVTLTIRSTDGQTLDPVNEDVIFTSEDEGVATIELIIETGKLRVMGIAAGSTTITAVRSDTSIVTFPEEPVTYTPLAVTVT